VYDLQLIRHAIDRGEKVLLIDDLIATGGTATAAARLLKDAGADMVAACFVVDLPGLGGAGKLRDAGIEVQSLLSF
jgi:adenine phosphoribosyltransferase